MGEAEAEGALLKGGGQIPEDDPTPKDRGKQGQQDFFLLLLLLTCMDV